MFFFFVGGVEQQVRQVIKAAAGRCIRCGGSYADLVEYDNVLKVFFVPVWRWPGKEPAMYCENCSLFLPQSFSLPPNQSPMLSEALHCHSCSRVVDPEFRFCPFCSTEL